MDEIHQRTHTSAVTHPVVVPVSSSHLNDIVRAAHQQCINTWPERDTAIGASRPIGTVKPKEKAKGKREREREKELSRAALTLFLSSATPDSFVAKWFIRDCVDVLFLRLARYIDLNYRVTP